VEIMEEMVRDFLVSKNVDIIYILVSEISMHS
jgi:hypothetical protein